MGRVAAGWGTPASGGIQFEPILIIPALSIPPWPRPYRFGEFRGLDNHLEADPLRRNPKIRAQ